MRARQFRAIAQHQMASFIEKSGNFIDSIVPFCSNKGVSLEIAKIQTASPWYIPFYKRKKGRRSSKSPIIQITLSLAYMSPIHIPSWVVNRSVPSAPPTAGNRTCQMSANTRCLDGCDPRSSPAAGGGGGRASVMLSSSWKFFDRAAFLFRPSR